MARYKTIIFRHNPIRLKVYPGKEPSLKATSLRASSFLMYVDKKQLKTTLVSRKKKCAFQSFDFQHALIDSCRPDMNLTDCSIYGIGRED